MILWPIDSKMLVVNDIMTCFIIWYTLGACSIPYSLFILALIFANSVRDHLSEIYSFAALTVDIFRVNHN